ncbi:glycosyltransferase family 1 protein [Bacillus sp. MRMR6]|uniref:glycosyltransferase family 1 protein n=1 Tax=Bacillus sp. MRMR6 TaxID=1928617 RepID=UPI0009FB86C1|nr:glycosyltransferase family 1 protein [Bacillus sp. MRMR6]
MTNRVLHVFRAMNVGGAETMIMNVYRAMDRQTIQFDFLVDKGESGFYDQEILDLGGRIFQLPSPRMSKILSYRKELLMLLKNNQFSAIHSHPHSFSGIILEAAEKAKIPVRIAHSHTTSDGRKATLVRQFYQSFMKRLIHKNATHLFSCSLAAGESLFGRDAETIVLANSINLRDYERISVHPKSDTMVIGHVGRFDSVKNHPFFLEVFSHLRKKYPQASAVLVGDGPEKTNIQAWLANNNLQDSVKLLGIRSDVPTIISQFDLFLFPSIYEGLGNVVIEAQAAGVPCLVSDAVPKEINLAMNLVNFKSLQDSAESWAEEAEKIINKNPRPSWDERKLKLKRFGYDVADNVKYLENVYRGY